MHGVRCRGYLLNQTAFRKIGRNLDFIARNELGSSYFREGHTFFGQNSLDNGLLKLLVNPETPSQIENVVKIATYLNHYEFVAVAIKNHGMDEQTYKDWRRTVYVRAWESAQAFVVARRNKVGHPTLYEHFDELAKSWKDSSD